MRWYMCLVAFLAPVRFGSIIVPGEIATFPNSSVEWVFSTWPPFLLGVLSGFGLIWAAIACKRPLRQHPAVSVLWVWGGLCLASLVGLLRTTEWDYAITFILYLVGVGAFLAASLKLWLVDPAYRRWLLTAIVAGTFLCGLIGWYQRLWGFQEMRQFMEAQALQTGHELSVAMQGKLLQTRVHRPFFLPNSYAAHLILTGPLTLLLMWRAGGRFEPAKISRGVFLSVGGVVVLGALYFSRSRGAQLALGGGMGLAAFSVPSLRRWRWPLLGGAVIVGLALTVAVNQGRDLLSANVRFQYYATALRMILEHPFSGMGLGEFFPHYMRLKPFGAEETRAAHNMVLNLFSQTGVLGGLAATACLLLPAWIGLFLKQERRAGDTWVTAAAVAGAAAWSLHSLLDFNIQIPPTVLTAAVVPLFCFSDPAPATGDELSRCRRAEVSSLIIVGLLAMAAVWRVPGERLFRRLSDDMEHMTLRQVKDTAAATAAALPLSPYPCVLYGRVALSAGRPHAAVEAFRMACARTPHRSAFMVLAGQALLASGDVEAAVPFAEQALAWYPANEQAIVLNALIAVLRSGTIADSGKEAAWIESTLSCRATLAPGKDGIRVIIEPPRDGVPTPIPPRDLCAAFNGLDLRTPGRSTVVRFDAH